MADEMISRSAAIKELRDLHEMFNDLYRDDYPSMFDNPKVDGLTKGRQFGLEEAINTITALPAQRIVTKEWLDDVIAYLVARSPLLDYSPALGNFHAALILFRDAIVESLKDPE